MAQGVAPPLAVRQAQTVANLEKIGGMHLQTFLPFELVTSFLGINPEELSPTNEKAFCLEMFF